MGTERSMNVFESPNGTHEFRLDSNSISKIRYDDPSGEPIPILLNHSIKEFVFDLLEDGYWLR